VRYEQASSAGGDIEIIVAQRARSPWPRNQS